MTVRIRTLGGLSVSIDGVEVERLAPQGLGTALLVYLAVERTATRNQVIALLWPERDESRARHSLSQLLYELKGTLGEGWFRALGDRLQVADCFETDAVAFASAVEGGAYEEALPLYRGPFLNGFYLRDSASFERWVDRWRQRLVILYRRACREIVTRSLDRGDRAAALAAARHYADDAPFDTDAQRLLLELLIEGGDLPGAVRQYDRYARRLRADRMTPAAEIAALVEPIRAEAEAMAEAGDVLSSTLAPRPWLIVDSSVPRLVVLPFEHLGAREDEPFTQGITDEITNRLVGLSGLGVIARTSANRYRETDRSIAQIRRELGVDYVLEGMVRWDDSGGEKRVRVSPQLIRAVDATHLWAETYEAALGDTFRVQSHIAERVAEVLEIQLRPPERRSLHRRGSRDPDAHELCVRGMRRREESVAGALDEAVDLFQRAIELDPDYAPAYAGLAETYALMPSFTVAVSAGWLAKANTAAERAMELDPACAEGYVAAGMTDYLLNWDMGAAETHLRRAIELTPSNARALVFLAHVQCSTGRHDEAFETMARAHTLDPLSVATNFHVAFQAWQGHDRDLAVRQLRLVNQLAPEFDPASYILGGIHFLEGDVAATRCEWAPITMFGPMWRSLLDVLDEPAKARGVVDRIVELAPGAVHWYGASSLYSLLGAADRAFLVLESHYQNLRGGASKMATAGPSLVHLATDPFFDGLCSDPRCEDLLRRIGLG